MHEILQHGDSEFPTALRAFARPMTFAGDRSLLARPTLAIVGTRRPEEAARRFAHELAARVVRAGGVVVSGGAKGIDRAAHEGALEVGGATVAVLGTGAGALFPSDHADLYARVAEAGLCIWPFPAPTPARPGNFAFRNRVLVALSRAVLIVQASVPSGALNAAKWARRSQTPLWVVPGPVWNRRFFGCNVELTRGARPLVSERALFESLGLGSGSSARRRSPRPAEGGDAERRLLDLLEGESMHLDDIIEKLRVERGVLQTALLTLTLEGVLVESPLGHFRRAK